MNDNTEVILYGDWECPTDEIIQAFDWQKILFQSAQLLQCMGNPQVFKLKGVANIYGFHKEICVHPGDARTLKPVKEVLMRAVSEYYNCACYISTYHHDTKYTVTMRKSTAERPTVWNTSKAVTDVKWRSVRADGLPITTPI